MRTRTSLRIVTALLLLISLSGYALPQSTKSQKSQQEIVSSTLGTPPSGSAGEQGASGIIASGEASQIAVSVPQPSSYSRFISPDDGLTQKDLIRYALAHNGELAAARQVIAEARGRLRQAGLRPNPMIDSSYQHGVTSRDDNLGLSAELPLELGGRRVARIAVAQREIELREAEVADFERKLAGDVRLKYSNVIAAARTLRFSENLLTLTRDSHRLVQTRVELGKSAPLEQTLVFVELNRVETMRINTEGKTELAMLELKKMLGMPPDERLQLRDDFDINLQPAPKSDALRNALASRPDLLAARTAENLALAQIEQARTEGKVDASIFANYMRQDMGFGVRGINDVGMLAPVQGIFHYVGFGVKLTLPVRNKNQGAIEAAQAQLEAARNRREFAEVVVRNEVAASYVRFNQAQAALAVYRDGVLNQAQRNLGVIRQSYQLGQKSLLDYIGEERRFIDLETGYTEVLKEYYDSLVEIERAAAAPVPSA